MFYFEPYANEPTACASNTYKFTRKITIIAAVSPLLCLDTASCQTIVAVSNYETVRMVMTNLKLILLGVALSVTTATAA